MPAGVFVCGARRLRANRLRPFGVHGEPIRATRSFPVIPAQRVLLPRYDHAVDPQSNPPQPLVTIDIVAKLAVQIGSVVPHRRSGVERVAWFDQHCR